MPTFETNNPSENAVFGRNDAPGSDNSPGVHGAGVFGLTFSPGAAGVFGSNNDLQKGVGVQGNGPERGVSGHSEQGSGVFAHSSHGQGLTAFSDNNIGVFAQGLTFSGVFQGAFVVNKNPASTSDINGCVVINDGNLFLNHGSIFVKGGGDVVFGDFAEDFSVTDGVQVEPGTVMVLESDGALRESKIPYDKRVAGVISGAGDYKPGLVLDRRPDQHGRVPLALMGRVYCKVDAEGSPIEVGDLLTTSPTPGHAMKAVEPMKAFGAVIGKALRPLEIGRGLIPILIALQ